MRQDPAALCYKDGHYIPAREIGKTYRFSKADCPYCRIAQLRASIKDAQRDTARGAIAIIEDFDHVSRLGGIITANDIITAIKERYQI